jgi:hypothetical protein
MTPEEAVALGARLEAAIAGAGDLQARNVLVAEIAIHLARLGYLRDVRFRSVPGSESVAAPAGVLD